MRVLFSSLFLLFTGFLNAQTFEIPAEGFPFYEVLEWKGQGAIYLNRDPSMNQKQVYLTLVANEGKSTWNENFSPGGKEFYYISEDAGRYVYFLEHLELKSGKISFHQLNSAGNIKSNAVSFTAALKKIGDFPPEELTLLDIVTSEKALIYLFSHTNRYVKSTTAEGHFHSYTDAAGIVSGAVSQQTNNPSRLLTAEFTGKFVASLATRWLVFAKSQLPVKGAVSFEYVEK